ncbi:hypothetical protein MLD52_15435 [Puniceicoccaceae bacterium K14]|nr:hypothetical protein [Puniceicoccaceae bacterium K14]
MQHQIRERDFIISRSFYTDISSIIHWEELIECSLQHLLQLIPSDCLCWNEWSPGFEYPKRIETNSPYTEAMASLLPILGETIDFHPVIRRLDWQGLGKEVHVLSNYQTQANFKQNPLFKEVYSHLDACYQAVYHFATTSSAELILSLNRRLCDFSKHECQLLKLTGDAIALVAKSIHQREDALKKANAIATLFEETYGLANITKLSTGEIILLQKLSSGSSVSNIAKTKNVRRDTVSRQLSIAREKLGLTSNKELVSAFRNNTVEYID